MDNAVLLPEVLFRANTAVLQLQDSDCCWLTAVSLPRSWPWLQEIASLKVTPLPEDSLEPMISCCGDIDMPLCLNLAQPWRIIPIPQLPKLVQLRPRSQLHCGSASVVQFCLPPFHTRVSSKIIHQYIHIQYCRRVCFREPNLRYYNFLLFLKSSQFNRKTPYV